MASRLDEVVAFLVFGVALESGACYVSFDDGGLTTGSAF